ncbi:alpha-galactosidase [Clostridium aestuarii]|uniref:Alpha-galactosidase n=1 Tax=Clostridium aestuarii TaxID=338193 RepID=A0ABT4CZP6_9CLOT|nr:glycoside hydrolase family 36 protein [Clostridium aestuarii]MCY6483415.1 alpha-galactosidase [Clostridium aestuarii]
MNIEKIYISYYKKDKLKEITLNLFEAIENDDIRLEFKNIHQCDESMLEVIILTKKEIVLEKFFMEYSLELKNKNMFVNGYQSWTESGEMSKNDELKNLSSVMKSKMETCGDYYFYDYKGKKGVLHSYTFTYFKGNNDKTLFLGSVDEEYGYTIFEADLKSNKLKITKDCSGLKTTGEICFLKLYMGYGSDKNSFKNYFSFFKNKKESADMGIGWTSLYNYYGDVTQDIVLENIENIKNKNIPMDIIEIDDGYQTAVGDWLSINEKFPLGMNFISYKIKSAGYQPGIWVAPFICEKNSKIFKNHKEWLLKDKSGKPVAVGYNSKWGGKFYALDFYNLKFRENLANIFYVMINIWGYKVVKLDFLYAAALIPRKGKTRAGIMKDVIEFLNDIIGERAVILASGVPLSAAFGKVDFCRIGADTAAYWEDKKLKILRCRERASTISALNNTIARFRLNGNVFYNVSSGCLLRKQSNKLNKEQKYSLLLLNNLLGGLVFLSDNINEYDDEEMYLFKSMFPKIKGDVNYINGKKDVYEILFEAKGKKYIVLSNLKGSEVKVKLPKGKYFDSNNKDLIVNGSINIKLKPYESKCLHKINDSKTTCFLGSTGHLLPGYEIDILEEQEGRIYIQLNDKFINRDNIYLKVKDKYVEIFVNGKKHEYERKEEYLVITL